MKVTNTAHALGATIEGIDLGRPLPDSAYEAIVRALGERGVLRFPRQKLTARQLADFSARFTEANRWRTDQKGMTNGSEPGKA